MHSFKQFKTLKLKFIWYDCKMAKGGAAMQRVAVLRRSEWRCCDAASGGAASGDAASGGAASGSAATRRVVAQRVAAQ